MKVSSEESVRVENVVVLSYNNSVAFKKSVSLMARQKKLKGCVRKSNGVAFGDFSRVVELGIIWICHLSQTE